MKKFVLLFGAVLVFLQLSAQDYFARSYDPFGHASEDAVNVYYKNDTLFLFGSGLCEDQTIRCHKVTAIDMTGDLLFGKEHSCLDSGKNPVIDGSTYYIGGDDEPVNSKLKIFHSSLEGDSLGLVELVSPDNRFDLYFDYGLFEYEDQLIVYGQVNDSIDDKTKIAMFWVDKALSLDTITIIEPPLNWMLMQDMELDHNGNLTTLSEYIDTLSNGFLIRYKGVTKYNRQMDTLFNWTSYHYIGNNAERALSINQETGDMIFVIPSDVDNSKGSVMCIDSLGNTRWQYLYPTFDNFYLLNVTLAENGEILVVGYIDTPGPGIMSWLFRLDKEGHLLWERVFVVDRDEHPLNPPTFDSDFSYLSDVIELQNGDIVAVGHIQNYYNDLITGPRNDQDLWVVKTNNEGCLSPGCGYTQEVDLDNSTGGFVNLDNRWHVTDYPVFSPGTSSRRFRFNRDTIAWFYDSPHLLVEFSTQEFGDNNWTLTNWAYYEDNGRVWRSDSMRQELIYDFTLELGEKILSTAYEYEMEVTQIDSILLEDGTMRKRLTLDNVDGNCPDESVNWIEGIGDTKAPIWPTSPCSIVDRNPELSCFFEDDFLNYTTTGGGCWIVPNKELELDTPETLIYPNPSNGLFTIAIQELSVPLKIKVSNNLGVMICENAINNKLSILDLNAYPDGVYYYAIQSNIGIIKAGKLVLIR